MMRTDEFDYILPEELVAQEPEGLRPASRLLMLDRSDGSVRHGRFADIVNCLREKDLVVLNETKVIPARIDARKRTGGAVEILLAEQVDPMNWSCLVKGVRKGLEDTVVFVGDTPIALTAGTPYWNARFCQGGDAARTMAEYGRMPLPNYIKRKKGVAGVGAPDDYARYQTVYAVEEGSIAAPTAGLHFNEELLGRISAAGIGIARLTLHIGIGTFLLIKSEHMEEHKMRRQ